MTTEISHTRLAKSAKHFLAAVVFRESSQAALLETKGTLLPCIGFYYVCFHSAVSMLWLCDKISENDLSRIRHSQVRKLIEVNLLQTGKLDRSFIHEYEQLQDLREYANYNFGSKAPKYEYPQMTDVMEVVSNAVLAKTRTFLITELDRINKLSQYQAIIGDDIGTDLIKLHSGAAVAENVWKYLMHSSLTT
jgi:uncharacterized protein (UPF0332 family)